MTIKQRQFLKEYIKTGNATQSVLKVYDCSYESARRIASENLTKLDIKDEVKFWMEKEGLTDQKIVSKINELIDNKDWRATADGINKAMKLKGLDKDKVEVSGQIKLGEKMNKIKEKDGFK